MTIGHHSYAVTKLPESGVLCGNIIEFGVGEDHLSWQDEDDQSTPLIKRFCNSACQTRVILFLYPAV